MSKQIDLSDANTFKYGILCHIYTFSKHAYYRFMRLTGTFDYLNIYHLYIYLWTNILEPEHYLVEPEVDPV
jgi:hypothetical protein